jgi:hypothetical protein
MHAVRKQLYAYSVMEMTCTHPSRGLHVVSRALPGHRNHSISTTSTCTRTCYPPVLR